jgi:hypothetical protein
VRELALAFLSSSAPTFPLTPSLDAVLPRRGHRPKAAASRRTPKSVAGFGVERREGRMAEAVAADEVDNQKHEQRTANHHGDRDLQPEL